MKLFLLEQKNAGWDEIKAKAILAENETHARFLANNYTMDEGEIWQDIDLVSCTEINMNKPNIVLNAGNNE